MNSKYKVSARAFFNSFDKLTAMFAVFYEDQKTIDLGLALFQALINIFMRLISIKFKP
jgi:hypothetical protein